MTATFITVYEYVHDRYWIIIVPYMSLRHPHHNHQHHQHFCLTFQQWSLPPYLHHAIREIYETEATAEPDLRRERIDNLGAMNGCSKRVSCFLCWGCWGCVFWLGDPNPMIQLSELSLWEGKICDQILDTEHKFAHSTAQPWPLCGITSSLSWMMDNCKWIRCFFLRPLAMRLTKTDTAMSTFTLNLEGGLGASTRKVFPSRIQRDGNRWCSLGFTLREATYSYVISRHSQFPSLPTRVRDAWTIQIFCT